MKTLMQQLSKNTRVFVFNTLVILITATVFTACGDDDDPVLPDDDQTIVEVAQSDGDFETLVSALQDAELVSPLNGDGPFTVFAPTDDAFAGLPEGLLESLTTEQLSHILSYHVVSAEVASGDLQAEQSVDALAGGQLFITAGDGVTVNDNATVITADIEASNGIIHSIDQVVLPDSYQDVVDIISKRYFLQTLEEAVVQAELVSTLKADGPYTVFAPDNASFEGLDLSGLSQQQLQDILTYHVLPAKVLSGDLTASQTVATVNGDELTIDVSGEGSVSITDQQGNVYQVTEADLEGTNGVVHIIDGVLMPGS